MKLILLQQMSDFFGILLNGIYLVCICIVVFLVLRMFFLWYWKIDTLVHNQEKQIAILMEILKEQRTIKPGSKIDLEV